MNDKQIISEQLEDYLAPKLAEDLTGSMIEAAKEMDGKKKGG